MRRFVYKKNGVSHHSKMKYLDLTKILMTAWSQQTERWSSNRGRVHRNFSVILKFTERPKSPGIILGKQGLL